MKKIKLDLDQLSVSTFATAKSPAETRGTVRGHATLACTEQFACTWGCGGGSMHEDSCGATCGGVCGPQSYAMHGCTAIE